MIDWSRCSAEEALDVLKAAPRIAGVWVYSDLAQGYIRYLAWDSKKGTDVGWLAVSRVWTSGDRKQWFASYAYDGDEHQRKALGPFSDRFAAAKAADDFLESEGWKVCK